MTIDRELLELAAKAGGIIGEYESWTGQGFKEGIRQVLNGAKCLRPWNPLTDDGDALRLAVKTGEPFVVRSRCVTTMGGLVENYDPAVSGDDLRATRLVIVRAAAAIGKAMK